MASKQVHLPVMANEVVQYLRPKPEMVFCDGTVGAGGHATALLEAVEKTNTVAWIIGIDRDREMLSVARQKLHDFQLRGHRIDLVHGSYAEIPEILHRLGVTFDVMDSILLDLGISSLHLDKATRGFSFSHEGPLDMRIDQTEEKTARDFLENIGEKEFINYLRESGEDRYASTIARKIKQKIKEPGIENTKDLAQVVARAIPAKDHPRNIHVATKTFQAIRLGVNEELKHLNQFLDRVPTLLRRGSRLGIISFHSSEDRMVKNSFRTYEKPCTCPPNLPICTCGKEPVLHAVQHKPILPSEAEISRNPRARSARFRVAERV